MSPEPAAYRKKQRFTTFVFFFLSGLITASWASRIPDIQGRLGMNNAQWGTVLFVIPVGLITGLIFSSWLIARYGTRFIMMLSCTGLASALCLSGVVGTGVQLMAVLFLVGVFRTLLNISINTHALQVQKLYEQPILSTFHGVWSLACFVAAGIGTLLIIWGITPALHFLGVALLAIPAIFLFSPKKGTESIAPLEKRPFFIKPDRYLFTLGCTAFCAMVCEGAMFDWSVNYFEKVVQPGKEWVTAGYTAFIVTMALGRLAGDRVIAAFGPVTVLMTNAALMAAGFTIAALFPYLMPATLRFLIIGIGDSVIVPIIYSLSAQSTKMQPGYALASVTMIGYVGFLIGPLLIGYLSEGIGMQWAFGVVGVFSLLIIILAMRIRTMKA